MKAIVEVAKPGSAIHAARQQLVAARKGQSPDFHLSFESARTLFSELTPARLDLLDTLRRVGPCSVYGLAKSAERNYSNVHTDVGRLEELGLVERTEAGEVSVPFEAVEILVPLAQVAAGPAQPREPNAEDPLERLKGSGKRGTRTDKVMHATRGDNWGK
jgi:predicted transcriptional regulator